MPTLKDLVCHVQWADTGSPFPEYETQYGDGIVETYIAIPSHPQVFTIRLTSRKFISPGLSMVVFIDGNYQCNRNRVNLQPSEKEAPDMRTTIDFLVRQKEKPLGDGMYLGREWRFDDCNLVSQLPDGVDKNHFDELGTIEVLVLRCRSNHGGYSECSTASSAEHSGILDDTADAREEVKPGDSASQANTGKLSAQPEPPQTEVQDAFGGLFGLFDGPADGWPSFVANPGDAPGDGYDRWHWQAPGGHPGSYGPQERSQPSFGYRPASEHYAEPRRIRYDYHDYHDSPPSSAYAHPPNPPPPSARPDRHVHFDYGDGRGSQPNSYHSRYDHQPHHTWERDHQHAYSSPRPSYHRTEYHRYRNPYPEYLAAPEGGHYMYNADRKAYSQYPDQNHGSSHPRTPLAGQATPHAYYQPPIQGANHNPSTFAASQANLANPAPPATPFPPLPPKIPVQPTNLPPIHPQPVPYPIPIWFPPPTGPVPPFPTAVPIYPPPNNAPLFHTQRIDTTSAPVGPNGSSSQRQGGDDAKKGENNNSNTTQSSSAQDALQNTNNGSNGGWGNSSGDNTSGTDNSWANGGVNDSGNNSNAQNLNRLGDNDNNTTRGGSNDDRNSNNSGQNWGDNDNNAGTGQTWDNNNANPGGGSWQSEPTQNNNGYSQSNNGSNNGGGWQNEPIQNNSGYPQSNNGGGWANETQNPGFGGNGPASVGNNNQINSSTSNNGPVSSGNPSNSRPLYGPFGAYYTSKADAENAPPAEAEEEPRYDVPHAIAQSKGVTKQVQPGKGYLYTKKRCNPHYFDTLEEPYARFVFKYRTKEQLRDELGVEITAEPSPNEDVNALENMDKAELIQMVLRAKGALGGTIPSPPPKVTPPLVKSFEQVPVVAPDVAFLKYNLPPPRHASSTNPGLGIRLSNASSNQSNMAYANQGPNNNWNNNCQTGNSQQNGNGSNNGGSQNWQTNNQQQGNNNNGGDSQSWANAGNNNNNNNGGWNDVSATNKNGWDGQQEKHQPRLSVSSASQRFKDFRFGAQQARSHRTSSMISPKGQAQGQGQGGPGPAGAPPPGAGEMLDYVLNNPEAAAQMGMAGPPPPIIAFTGSGTVGGGQTNIDMGGAGPRPPTPTGPPPPLSPPSVQGQGGFGPENWEGDNPVQPRGGW
ncbi:uncharacterized protein Z520_10906 [Fonsecaea multimorphosa CBS 102226]|uniref:Uncharacterized protein n=1 Tax=Fonsecaea multimorphosa CBS 102226 TaxID=1442371 RepID=A0A0D2I8H2_9EURO|nr:uncharacterized protein Z520_10906 [Fonsecaea multimorphosa CBS 102226]KIX93486.1 hypothetical protein Z520_10906 [Fonsecaea multimorphosa CBS 102226]OAL18661.1 hypothetical protein AYO22_10480 [Fonsecaea multimorphosa]